MKIKKNFQINWDLQGEKELSTELSNNDFVVIYNFLLKF